MSAAVVKGGAHGASREGTPSVERLIGNAWAAVDAIRVEYAPQSDALAGLKQQLHTTLAKRAGVACGGVTLIAPRGAGKSATLDLFVEEVRRDAPDGSLRALRVSMDAAGTIESIPSVILAALGDPRPDLGRPQLRWLKAVDRLRTTGVRLLMLDEFNRAARRPHVSGPIGQAVCEKIMDAGVAAVAFVGEDDASLVFDRAPLLLERIDEELDLTPMDWLRPGDDKIWTDFVEAFDAEMTKLDIVSVPSGFAAPDLAESLCTASGGLVRRFVKIVRLALADAMRRGDDFITREDLRAATQGFAVKRRFIASNPFGQ